jgi:uncharacterized protein (TIGR02145 family)
MKKLIFATIIIFVFISSCTKIKYIDYSSLADSLKTIIKNAKKTDSIKLILIHPILLRDTIIIRDTIMVINTVKLSDTIVMRDTIIISPLPIKVTNIDIDGNVYDTVRIGNQTWMKENLRVTRLNDGGRIVSTDDIFWGRIISPGYCWYNLDINNKDTYGALYNWWAVASGKLCPVGWHVPTVTEWEILGYQYRYTGMVELMETGTSHWISGLGTNTTGFTALPGGSVGDDGTQMLFSGMGEKSGYWTPDGPDYTHGGGLWAYPIPWTDPWGQTPTSTLVYDPNAGFSVRCLKDN